MNTSPPRVSGADIVVPSSKPATPSAPAPKVDVDALLQKIRIDLDGCRTTDRNVLLTIAIEALMNASVDTGPQIVGAAVSLGFPRKHVGVMLGKGRGWLRGADGRYRLLAAVPA